MSLVAQINKENQMKMKTKIYFFMGKVKEQFDSKKPKSTHFCLIRGAHFLQQDPVRTLTDMICFVWYRISAGFLQQMLFLQSSG